MELQPVALRTSSEAAGVEACAYPADDSNTPSHAAFFPTKRKGGFANSSRASSRPGGGLHKPLTSKFVIAAESVHRTAVAARTCASVPDRINAYVGETEHADAT